MRNLGMYVNSTALPGMSYRFEDNVWRGWRYERDQVHTGETAPDHLLRVTNSTTPITFSANAWSGPAAFANVLAQRKGTNGNVSGRATSAWRWRQSASSMPGYPTASTTFAWRCGPTSPTRGGNAPVSYAQGTIVMHQ